MWWGCIPLFIGRYLKSQEDPTFDLVSLTGNHRKTPTIHRDKNPIWRKNTAETLYPSLIFFTKFPMVRTLSELKRNLQHKLLKSAQVNSIQRKIGERSRIQHYIWKRSSLKYLSLVSSGFKSSNKQKAGINLSAQDMVLLNSQ